MESPLDPDEGFDDILVLAIRSSSSTTTTHEAGSTEEVITYTPATHSCHECENTNYRMPNVISPASSQQPNQQHPPFPGPVNQPGGSIADFHVRSYMGRPDLFYMSFSSRTPQSHLAIEQHGACTLDPELNQLLQNLITSEIHKIVRQSSLNRSTPSLHDVTLGYVSEFQSGQHLHGQNQANVLNQASNIVQSLHELMMEQSILRPPANTAYGVGSASPTMAGGPGPYYQPGPGNLQQTQNSQQFEARPVERPPSPIYRSSCPYSQHAERNQFNQSDRH